MHSFVRVQKEVECSRTIDEQLTKMNLCVLDIACPRSSVLMSCKAADGTYLEIQVQGLSMSVFILAHGDELQLEAERKQLLAEFSSAGSSSVVTASLVHYFIFSEYKEDPSAFVEISFSDTKLYAAAMKLAESVYLDRLFLRSKSKNRNRVEDLCMHKGLNAFCTIRVPLHTRNSVNVQDIEVLEQDLLWPIVSFYSLKVQCEEGKRVCFEIEETGMIIVGNREDALSMLSLAVDKADVILLNNTIGDVFKFPWDIQRKTIPVCDYYATLSDFVEWCKTMRCTRRSALNMGIGGLSYGLICSMLYEQGFLQENAIPPKRSYEGGIHLDPEIGLMRDPVLMFDFKSQYPAEVITWNICSSTYLAEDSRDKVSCRTCPDGSAFVCCDTKRRGVVVSAMAMLMQAREDAKKSSERRILQSGFKLAANALLGLWGNPNGPMYNPVCAAALTACGRERLVSTAKAIEKNFDECRVVYGNTDSVAVCTPGKTREEVEVLASSIVRWVNVESGVVTGASCLQVECISLPTYIQSKNAYAMMCPALKTCGLFTNSVCSFCNAVLKETLQDLLSMSFTQEELMQKARVRIDTVRQVPIEELGIPRVWTLSSEKIGSNSAHSIAASLLSTKPEVGSTVVYVRCKDGPRPLSQANTQQVDYDSYLCEATASVSKMVHTAFPDDKTRTHYKPATRPSKKKSAILSLDDFF